MSKAIGTVLRYKRFTDLKTAEINPLSGSAIDVNKTVSLNTADNNYINLRNQYRRKLLSIFEEYSTGGIDKETAMQFFNSMSKNTFISAFDFGFKLSKNPKFDVFPSELDDWIKGAAVDEASFFSDFLDDIKKYPGAKDPAGKRRLMPYERRLEMYVNSLDGIFFSGVTTAMPDDTPVWWELSPTCIHCEDCLGMSAANPWTVKTLPFVPRSGHTECKSKCCCHLRFGEREDSGEPPAESERASADIKKRNDGSELDLNRKEEFNQLYSSMNYHRQMAHALKKGRTFQELSEDEQDLVKYHLEQRRLINAKIIENQSIFNVRTVPNYSVSDLTAQADQLFKQGYNIVYNPLQELKAGDDIAALTNTLIDVGTVDNVVPTLRTIAINSVSREHINLYYEKSLFWKQPGIVPDKSDLPEIVYNHINKISKKLNKDKIRWDVLQAEATKRAELNLTDSELIRITVKKMEEYMNAREPVIRAPESLTLDIVKSGRFKSQFETSTSKGSFDPEYRSKVEKDFFGYSSNLPHNERPIYGTWLKKDGFDNTASQYGGAIFVLKDDIKKRATFTWTNSFGYALESKTYIGNPMIVSDKSTYIHSGSPAMFRKFWKNFADTSFSGTSYAELQYHGGVTMGDVKELRFFAGVNNSDQLKELAKQVQAIVNFPVKVID